MTSLLRCTCHLAGSNSTTINSSNKHTTPGKYRNWQYTWVNQITQEAWMVYEANHQTHRKVLQMYGHYFIWQLEVATFCWLTWSINAAHSPYEHNTVSVATNNSCQIKQGLYRPPGNPIPRDHKNGEWLAWNPYGASPSIRQPSWLWSQQPSTSAQSMVRIELWK